MALIRALISLLVILAMIAAGALFSLQNTVAVPLDLLFIQFSERTLALWLLLSLTLGAAMGLLAGSIVILNQRARLAAIRRQKERLSLEVDRLRKVGIADSE